MSSSSLGHPLTCKVGFFVPTCQAMVAIAAEPPTRGVFWDSRSLKVEPLGRLPQHTGGGQCSASEASCFPARIEFNRLVTERRMQGLGSVRWLQPAVLCRSIHCLVSPRAAVSWGYQARCRILSHLPRTEGIDHDARNRRNDKDQHTKYRQDRHNGTAIVDSDHIISTGA